MLTEQLFKMDKQENLPVITLPWFNNCRVIIDTGSTIPIWLKEITILNLKGATKEDRKVEVNGVGGKTVGHLYRVNLDIGDIHFKNMPIIHKEIRVADAYMILPFSVFENMVIEFNNLEHTFKIQANNKEYYRELKIKDKYGKPHIYLAGTYATEEEYNKRECL